MVRDAVLAETRLSCAICEMAFALDIHHIQFYSLDGSNDAENLLALCPRCHRLVHSLNVSASVLYRIKRHWVNDGYPGKEIIALQKYLTDLRKHCEEDPAFHAYVPLEAYVSTDDSSSPADSLVERWLKDERLSCVLVVLGDMGAGKTSFLRHLAHSHATKFIHDLSHGVFPVLVYLKAFAKSSTFTTVLQESLRRYGLSLDNLSNLSRHSTCLLLLDGFDEANHALSQTICNSGFEEIVRSVPTGTKIVISSRISYFQSREAELSHFTKLPESATGLIAHGSPPEIIYLASFGPIQRDLYLQMRLPEHWQAANKFIRDNYDLSDICRRPIMIAMLADLYPELFKQCVDTVQPYTRAWLYEEYAYRWLEREIIQKARGIEVSEMLLLFEKLGYDLVELSYRKRLTFEWKFTTSMLESYLVQTWGGSKILSKIDLDHAFRESTISGFLTRNADGEWFFGHRSFAEYLAARRLHHAILRRDWSVLENTNNRVDKRNSSVNVICSTEVDDFLRELVSLKQSEDILCDLLVDDNPSRRQIATIILCGIKDAQIEKRLVDAFVAERDVIVLRVFFLMQPHNFFKGLEGRLTELCTFYQEPHGLGDYMVRESAIRLVGRFRYENAREVLWRVLAEDTWPNARLAAALSLVMLKDHVIANELWKLHREIQQSYKRRPSSPGFYESRQYFCILAGLVELGERQADELLRAALNDDYLTDRSGFTDSGWQDELEWYEDYGFQEVAKVLKSQRRDEKQHNRREYDQQDRPGPYL